MTILSYYYREDWGDRYCSTNVAEWALVLGWIGASSVIYSYAVNMWFYHIQWDAFTGSNAAAKQKILKRLKCLQSPNFVMVVFNIVWFIIGQTRIWATHACDMPEYEMIMAMNSTVRPLSSHPSTLTTPPLGRPPACTRAELHLRRRAPARPVGDRVLRRPRLLLPAHA